MMKSKEKLIPFIISIISVFLAFLFLSSCNSKMELKTVNTYDQLYKFEIDKDFELYEKYPSFNRFENDKYTIEIEVFDKSNEITNKYFEDLRSGAMKDYSNMYFMKLSKIETTLQNDNYFPIVVLSGSGRDKSSLIPTYYDGYLCFVKTPDNILTVFLKYTSHIVHTPIDKSKAENYLKPIIKSLRYNLRLVKLVSQIALLSAA